MYTDHKTTKEACRIHEGYHEYFQMTWYHATNKLTLLSVRVLQIELFCNIHRVFSTYMCITAIDYSYVILFLQ